MNTATRNNIPHQILTHLTNAFVGIPHKIWLLSLISLINRSGAMVICFLTLYLTESLHFSIEQAGYVMSSFGVGAIIGAFLGGKLTDRFGYRNVMLFTLIGSGFALLIAMYIRTFWAMCITLLLMNMISEAFRPASSVSIRMNSNEEVRTRAFSLFRVFVNLAITIALSVGGILIALGWKWLFICDALTCFGAAGLLLYVLPKEESTGETISTDTKKTATTFTNSPNALKDKSILYFTILTLLGAIIFMQLIWTVPAFFKDVYKWSEAQIGFMAAVNGLVVMLVELPLIFQIEGKKSANWFIRLGILCYLSAYLFLMLPAQWGWFWALGYMIVISFGEIFVMPFSATWVTQKAPEDRQGQYMALYVMAYSIANVIAPLLGTQIIAHFGYNQLWTTLVVLSVVTWFGFSRLNKVQYN